MNLTSSHQHRKRWNYRLVFAAYFQNLDAFPTCRQADCPTMWPTLGVGARRLCTARTPGCIYLGHESTNLSSFGNWHIGNSPRDRTVFTGLLFHQVDVHGCIQVADGHMHDARWALDIEHAALSQSVIRLMMALLLLGGSLSTAFCCLPRKTLTCTPLAFDCPSGPDAPQFYPMWYCRADPCTRLRSPAAQQPLERFCVRRKQISCVSADPYDAGVVMGLMPMC